MIFWRNKKYKNIFFFIIVVVIVLLGSFLRYINLSEYKIYPDSYQSLLVANNIRSGHSVVGYLGTNGMVYPQFVAWTRPGFPLLILLFSFFTKNTVTSAQFLCLISSILAIGVSFFLIRQVFQSTIFGILGTFLIAFSFNHIIWSGFIATETTGVILLLVIQILIFLRIKRSTRFSFYLDLLIGAALGFVVFVRYEYLLLLPPLALYFVVNKKGFTSILTIFSMFCFTVSIIFASLFPVRETAVFLWKEISDLITFFIILVLGIFLLTLIYLRNTVISRVWSRYGNGIVSLFFTLLCALIFLQMFLRASILPRVILLGISSFVRYDLLLFISFFSGILLMLKRREHRATAYYILMIILFLGTAYIKSNPTMQRYWTHIIPFLIIPAAYGSYWIMNWNYKMLRNKRMIYKLLGVLILGFIVVLIYFQILSDITGVKNWNQGAWVRTGYEELSAKKLKSNLKTHNNILIVSLPEPYYFFTNQPTQSISSDYPYLFLQKNLKNKQMYIIQDLPMRLLFPKFNKIIDTKLQKYKWQTYYVKRNLNYGPDIYRENEPVIVYKLFFQDYNNILTKP